MFSINIKAEIDKFQKGVSAAAFKQIPFATAQALTALARQAAQAEKDNEAKVLDRPKPFTQNSIKVAGATTKSQSATVFMQDIAAKYLEPYEFGGTNVLNSRAVLTPIDAYTDLDQFGNLPRNWLAKLKGRKDIFIGPVQTRSGLVNGIWQRAVADGSKVEVTKVNKKGVVRTYRTRTKLNTTGRLKLLVKFTDAHPVRQHLNWFGVAKTTVDHGFKREMGKALAKAVATAK